MLMFDNVVFVETILRFLISKNTKLILTIIVF